MKKLLFAALFGLCTFAVGCEEAGTTTDAVKDAGGAAVETAQKAGEAAKEAGTDAAKAGDTPVEIGTKAGEAAKEAVVEEKTE